MRILFLVFISIGFSACSLPKYYQVYKTKTSTGKLEENKVVFEDDHCMVYYDLWDEGGNIGFRIFNKTDKELTLDLNKTFFILNGEAYQYYQNKTYSFSKGKSKTKSVFQENNYCEKTTIINSSASTKSNTTTYGFLPYMTIPSQTTVNVQVYKVTNQRYTSCEMAKYPKKKNPEYLLFTEETSPFVFSNLLTYTIEDESFKFENDFYVNEISNLRAKDMYSYVDTTFCGNEIQTPRKVFNNLGPNKFYIFYKASR